MTDNLVALRHIQNLLIFPESAFALDCKHVHVANGPRCEIGFCLITQVGPEGIMNLFCGLEGGEVGGRLAGEVDFVDGVFVVFAEGEEEEDAGDESDVLEGAVTRGLGGNLKSSEPFLF